jgi:cell division protein FtsW (lipid II flippase)
MAPAPPGAGSVSLTLATPAFFLLVATLGLFVAMLFVLHSHYPNRKRGFEGYFDAAGVSLGFLVFGVVLVVVLVVRDPQANATSWALYQTILTGYWLAFAIPVVTVGSSVQARSRGAIRWMVPSIVVAALMFLGIFAYYYSAAG